MFGIDDAIGLGIGAVGLGMQIFGGSSQSKASAEAAKISKDEALHEQNINNLKTKQMELEAHRSQLQTVRNMQRARALGIASAVSQGANKGSGLQGSLAQISDQANWNNLGIGQALMIGQDVNKENNYISQDKMKMADVQSDMASAQGLSSLGGSLVKSAGLFGQFGSSIGGMFKSSNPYYGPLDYNG